MEFKLSKDIPSLIGHNQNQSIINSANQIHNLINQENIDRKRAIKLLDELRATLDSILNNIEVYQEDSVTVSNIEIGEKEKNYQLLLTQVDEFVDILQNDFENLLLSHDLDVEPRFQKKLIKQFERLNKKLDNLEIEPRELHRQIKLLRDTVYAFHQRILGLNDIDFAKHHLRNKGAFANILLGLFGLSLITGGGCFAALKNGEITSETKETEQELVVLVLNNKPDSEPKPIVIPPNSQVLRQKDITQKQKPNFPIAPVVINGVSQALGSAVIGRAVNNLGKDTKHSTDD